MFSGGKRLRAMIATLATSVVVGSAIVFTAVPAAAADELPATKPPLLQRDDSVVTSDPLPTVQINNGYVWAQATIGTTVYAVGQFENARPAMAVPNTSLTPRSNILAFDITTGNLLPFAPSVNGTIKAVTPSPDGKRIYIGGSFNNVNGQTRWNFAALDAVTGQLVPGFNPAIGGSGVYALAAHGDSVFVGGLFTQANGTPRKNLAAFDAATGALSSSWTAQPDLQIDAMVIDPSGEQVILGGRFASVNGDGKWRGMAAVNIATGAVNPDWQGTAKVKNGWNSGSDAGKAGIFALNVDQGAVYGTGWVFANATVGNMEGVFALEKSSGATRWLADCLGDHYGVYSTGSVVYSTTHTHACGTMNLWPEQNPRTHRFVHAMTTDARGRLGNQPHAGGTYANWAGEPAPSAYAWYPDFATGVTSGLGQAGLSITGVGNTISIAGEFRAVNNRQFEGIVRFSTTPPGGAKDGPRTTTAAWGAPTAQALVPGRVRVSIRGTFDRDDRDLTYELLRTGTAAPVATQTVSSGWWDVPAVILQDRTVESGQEYTYRVRVKDGDGNTVTSQPVTATAVGGDAADYVGAVLDDGATLYYPMGDTMADWAGANAPDQGTGVQARQPGAATESVTGYSAFSGDANGRVSTTNGQPVGADFSTELWFRTTTTRGGKLIGYGAAKTGTSNSYDRHVYMRNDGRLVFGVYPGGVRTVTSPQSYRDGAWHHMVASQSAEGMRLYVDGQLVASDASVTGAEGYSGYWRIGGDNLNGWPDRPSSDWFAGDIDEVSVYGAALTPAQVSTHYAIGKGIVAPTAAIDVSADELDVSFDATGSTVSAGGSIVEYAWNFGDGSPAVKTSTPTTSHSYPATGSYTATLTVKDSHGLVGSAQRVVTVQGPNIVPAASFAASNVGLTITADASGSTDADGTIETYEWNWGEGDATGTGALASHRYSAPGTYTVTLTVTDDRGGKSTTTRDVEVTHAAPVASFTATPSALSVAVDASASTASDGATMSYSWSWGDGSPTSSGRTASHEYSADGEYDITLTVTDSVGSTTSVSRSVKVQATVYALLDEFDRTVSSGWGSAPTGGLWTTLFGSAAAGSVNGTQGVINLAPSGTRSMSAQGVTLRDSEGMLEYEMGFGPSNGPGYVGMVFRQATSDGYVIHAWHRNNGTIWLVAQQGGTTIATQTLTGMTWASGDSFVLKTEVTGVSPTTLRAKLWKKGASEPTAWQLNATDSTAKLQSAGYQSVRYNLAGSALANGTVRFDRVAIRNLAAPAPEPAQNTPPVADFTFDTSGLTVGVDASAATDSDGEIASYAWSWGDSSATSSGKTASHTYAAAGTYTVKLTVTDDDGATHERSRTVEVQNAPEPANLPPVADFTLDASGLVVDADASAASDSDGEIASYAWSWGDSSATSSGKTASHTYAAAGTYTVKLTVTDDDGATHEATKSITVDEPAAAEFVIRDDFGRSATASWGTADTGGAWTITGGAASAASVADGKGRFTLAAGATRFATLTATPVRNYLAEVDFTTSVGPDSGAVYAGFQARVVGADNYVVHAWLRPNGTVWLVAQRGGTVLQTSTLSGLTYSAGDTFTLKLDVSGTASTTLRAKLWPAAGDEPSAWQIDVSDSTPALQADGAFGIRVNRTTASTAPALVSFDRLTVTAAE